MAASPSSHYPPHYACGMVVRAYLLLDNSMGQTTMYLGAKHAPR